MNKLAAQIKTLIALAASGAAGGILISVLWDLPTDLYNRALIGLAVAGIAVAFGMAAKK